MKFNEKTFKICVIILMLAVFVFSFRYGYSNFNEKKEATVKEINELNAQLKEQQDKQARREEFETEIQRAKDMVGEKLDKYGPGNTPEKSTLFVVELEKAAGMKVSAISFGAETALCESTLIPTSSGLGAALFTSPLTLSIQTSYDGIKKAVDFINAAEEKKNISALSLTYNQENGQLTGTLVISEYAVYGLDKEYEKPQVDGPIKVKNIFSAE